MATLISDLLVVFDFLERMLSSLPLVIQLIFIFSVGLSMVVGMMHLLRR